MHKIRHQNEFEKVVPEFVIGRPQVAPWSFGICLIAPFVSYATDRVWPDTGRINAMSSVSATGMTSSP